MTKEDYKLIESFTWLARWKCKNRQDREDVMQDVCLRVLLNDDAFGLMDQPEKEKYIKWLITNRVIDLYRRSTCDKRSGKNVCITDAVAIRLITNPDVYSKLELKEIFQKAAKKTIVCETLILFASGYKNIEIAAMTGQKLNTVLARCRYARIFLRA